MDIKIAKDFGPKLGGSTVGENSGQRFFTLLEEKYSRAQKNNEQLHIYMDGASPYGISFVRESFGKLGSKYGGEKLKKDIVFHTDKYEWITKDVIQNDLWK